MLRYDVVLGVDKAARDTGRRIEMRVTAADRFAAAMRAEAMGDMTLRDRPIEYTHAVRVTPVIEPTITPLALAIAA